MQQIVQSLLIINFIRLLTNMINYLLFVAENTIDQLIFKATKAR